MYGVILMYVACYGQSVIHHSSFIIHVLFTTYIVILRLIVGHRNRELMTSLVSTALAVGGLH